MSADRLRQAASLLRERAEAATPGPWTHERGGDVQGPWPGLVASCVGPSWSYDADLIATMSPPVALALADLLDAVRGRYEAIAHTFPVGSNAGHVTATENATGWFDALAVADAILGNHS